MNKAARWSGGRSSGMHLTTLAGQPIPEIGDAQGVGLQVGVMVGAMMHNYQIMHCNQNPNAC